MDVTPPQVELLTPPDGTVVTGVLDIWGNVTDISLLDWTLTATGSSGKVITVWTDTAEKTAEQLGVLDTGEFADGETIEIALVAHDQAGHESTARGVFIKADHSAQPVVADVTVTAPARGEIITGPHAGRVHPQYAGSESDSRVIFDGRVRRQRFQPEV